MAYAASTTLEKSTAGSAWELPMPVARGKRRKPGAEGMLGDATAVIHRDKTQLQHAIDQVLVAIDRMISRQLDTILHHPRFQRLEASWRGLQHLVETEAEYDEELKVKIKLLNISWAELAKDLTRALEFDQSHTFRLIYSQEFDTPGGEPFGLMLGDYDISHRPRPGSPVSDTEVVQEMSRIAMAALCPFIANASSAIFGVDSFSRMPAEGALAKLFQQQSYLRWNQLRKDEHTRFVGLTLPRILLRPPYRADGSRAEPFSYEEHTGQNTEHFLWGGACFALGGVVLRAFANTGWFADIRGGVHAFGEGGVVRNMVYHRFACDPQSMPPHIATDVQIDDFAERELCDFGFIPLCSRPDIEKSLFFSNSSLHEPAREGSEIAQLNAKLSAMIQYMLCVSRFGHFIKIMVRDRIGSFSNAQECQRMLQNWLHQYTTSADGASAGLKARYPLAGSRVEVTDMPGRPGHFSCVIHLQPHFQLDQVVSSIRLVTELAVGPTGTGM